ncbi:MAG: CoA ester lyase [Anaerolineae bacterium]|nr:CoA ester lyase [Anaerolineae bacterium]
MTRLARSILIVPATDWVQIQMASDSKADVVILDLDDFVAPAHKVESRAQAILALNQLNWGAKVRAFRMNALDTPFAYRDLIEIVEAAGTNLDLVIVPKVDRPQDVIFVETLLNQIEAHSDLPHPLGLEVQIETAKGMMNVNEIAFASTRLEALVFGPGDYSASVRIPVNNVGERDEWDDDYPGHRWHYAMHRIVVAAHAAQLRAIDGPFANAENVEGFFRSSREAKGLGYDGKWCVETQQVQIANEVFIPSLAEIEYAQAIVECYERGVGQGSKAITFNGRILDAARVKMAHYTLHQARQASLL